MVQNYVISQNLFNADPHGWSANVRCVEAMGLPVDDNAVFIQSSLAFRCALRRALGTGCKAAQVNLTIPQLLSLTLLMYSNNTELGSLEYPFERQSLHGQITPDKVPLFEGKMGRCCAVQLGPNIVREIEGALTLSYCFHFQCLTMYFTSIDVNILE